MASAMGVGLTPSQNLTPIARPSLPAARILVGAKMLRQEAPKLPPSTRKAHHERKRSY